MSDVPAWMEPLVEVVANAMTAHYMPGPLGLRYREEDGSWDVLVYPQRMELVGGRHDGDVVSPGFSLDLEQVRKVFTRVDGLFWQAHPLSEQDGGPYVSIEGEYAGREVWLRILAFAPEDEGPADTFNINQQ